MQRAFTECGRAVDAPRMRRELPPEIVQAFLTVLPDPTEGEAAVPPAFLAA